jgi:hypothetical protein
MKRKRTMSEGPHVRVPKKIMQTEAWRAMSPGPKVLWIELRGWLRNDGLNNGREYLSCRDAGEAIGAHKDTVSRWYFELEHYGFLRQTAPGFLGSEGFGSAAKFRFTDLPYGTYPATRDYEKWDGVLFEYTGGRSQKRRPKKQKPVCKTQTACLQNPDIGKGSGAGSLCLQNPDIGKAPDCLQNPDITSLPVPGTGKSKGQGSLTERAPAQAGGAGSSPVPVASPLVARLDDLETRGATTWTRPQ